MFWIDAYSTMYQKANGFPVTILSKPKNKKAYFSMKPTTRAAYDLSMRENSIDGIITMDDIATELKPGNIFYLDIEPTGKYIIQSCSLWEQQPQTRNINAVKCNCKISVLRKGFATDESTEEEWLEVYKDIDGFISEVLKDSKNFNAGLEITTLKSIQIPQIDIENKLYDVVEGDRIVVKSLLDENRQQFVYAESIDCFGVQGVIRIQGTKDMRED